MFNAFTAARSTSPKPLTEDQKKKILAKERRYKNKTRKMANLAYLRREEWIMDASHSDNFTSKFFGGSIPLINPKQHTFRDIDTSSKGFSPFRSQSTSFEPSLNGGSISSNVSILLPGNKYLLYHKNAYFVIVFQ